MVKIVKNLRQLKILMNNSLMSPEVKFMLQHAEKNFIDLDGSDSDYSSEALEGSDEPITPTNVQLVQQDVKAPANQTPVPIPAKRFGTAPEDIVNNLALYLKKEVQTNQNKRANTRTQAAIKIQKWIRPILIQIQKEEKQMRVRDDSHYMKPQLMKELNERDFNTAAPRGMKRERFSIAVAAKNSYQEKSMPIILGEKGVAKKRKK